MASSASIWPPPSICPSLDSNRSTAVTGWRRSAWPMAARSGYAMDRRQRCLISAALTRDVIRLLKDLFGPAVPGRSWQAIQQAVAPLGADRRAESVDLDPRY